jgi:hypothetical protein
MSDVVAMGATEQVNVSNAVAANVEVASWREIDRQLRRVAKAQATLDAEELRWLAEAQQVELHRELGMASMLEYVERVLGHGPKVAHERLRVARELMELPMTRAALEEGRVSFSAVRELSRKVTAKTEGEWLEAVHGKCLREIEELLSGHKKGDRPGDPISPDLQLRRITLELTPPTMALFRDACRRLEDELGHHLTDDEIMAAMCASVLGGVSPRGDSSSSADSSPRGDSSSAADPSPRGDSSSAADPSPRGDASSSADASAHGARSTSADSSSRGGIPSSADSSPRGDSSSSPDVSPRRGSAPLDAASQRRDDASHATPPPLVAPTVAIAPARVLVPAPARVPAPEPRVAPYQIALTVCPSCDRGWHDAGGRAIAVPDSTIAQAMCDAQYIGDTGLVVPARAYQEVTPATARLVMRRDRGCCRVPGCRSARWLQIHHVVWREHGGSNDPHNLVCLCFAHHQAVHQGRIGLTGTAPDALLFDLAAYLANEPCSPR